MYEDGVGHLSLAQMVELFVIAGHIHDTAEGLSGYPHGGGASAVEVHGVPASEVLHECGQFGQRKPVCLVGTAICGEQQDFSLVGNAGAGAWVPVVVKGPFGEFYRLAPAQEEGPVSNTF
jgi:hypothetical protein